MFISIVNSDEVPSISPNIEEDANSNTPELITKYGYNAEVHFVTTEDGYILELHRISGGPKSPPAKGKEVCFLMHGLVFSSITYVFCGPNTSLGFRLADEGYDVWIGNFRGSIYSVNHVKFKPFGSLKNQKRFWRYSLHELGVYDLPASIDYILKQTNETKLHYIGHSQGCTAFFIMLSEKPEYNDKIETMHAMAPAVYLKHVKSRIIRVIKPFVSSLYHAKKVVPIHHIYPAHIQKKIFRNKKPTLAFCQKTLNSLMGITDQTIPEMLPIFFAHLPTGGSSNNLLHFGQLVNSGRFRNFDYGRIGNWMRYKSVSPPEYNLKNATIPVSVYYGQGDFLTVVKDIRKLIAELPNVVNDYLVPHEKFNHVDFVMGMDAQRLVYDKMVATIKSPEIMITSL